MNDRMNDLQTDLKNPFAHLVSQAEANKRLFRDRIAEWEAQRAFALIEYEIKTNMTPRWIDTDRKLVTISVPHLYYFTVPAEAHLRHLLRPYGVTLLTIVRFGGGMQFVLHAESL